MLIKDQAICIRATDFSETSQIVVFYTRQTGKVSAIAKGSKRPKSSFDGPIEMLSYGKIVFSDSTRDKLATLTEFEQGPAFVQLSANFLMFNCCLFAAELVNKLTDEYDPHPGLFDSFLELLQNISRSETKSQILSFLIFFQLSLLREVGLHPVFDCCVNCRSNYNSDWPESYFSSSVNGLICKDCEGGFADKVRLTKEASAVLNKLELAGESEKTLGEVEDVLIGYFTETLGHRPKMAKYIR